MNEKFNAATLDFATIIIESHEFTKEELVKMPNYVERKYPDAFYFG